MYLVMSGVVEVFVKHGKGNLALENIGVGSVIGQFSVIDSEIMICGFRAVSYGGALLLSLDKESINHLCTFSKEFGTAIDLLRIQMQDSGCPQIDYLRFNDLSPSQDLTNPRMVRLGKFQRAIKRLLVLARAMNKKGKTNFSLGGLFFELAEDEEVGLLEHINGTEEEVKNIRWQKAIVHTFDFENFMENETVQDGQEKLEHIKQTLETQNAVVKLLLKELGRVKFNEVSKIAGFKQDIARIFTLTEVERRTLPGFKDEKSLFSKKKEEEDDQEDKNIFEEHQVGRINIKANPKQKHANK